MRIVQLANFYGPRSGGLRTALNALGAGYAARGHEVVLVVPGDRASDVRIRAAPDAVPGFDGVPGRDAVGGAVGPMDAVGAVGPVGAVSAVDPAGAVGAGPMGALGAVGAGLPGGAGLGPVDPVGAVSPVGTVRRITVPAPRIPGTGGYRAVDPWRVRRLLDRLRPDAIEVSDRLTLRGLGSWASAAGVPSVVISHERLDRLLHQFLLPSATARRVADAANARMAAAYDTVVCTTAFAREEFDRIGVRNVRQVPLGVDLATFSPTRHSPELRARLGAGADALLVHCGRLSTEKHAERSIDTVAALCDAGHRVRLVVAGDGPRRAALQRRASGLPVDFLGFVPNRARLATLLASADVSLAPGPHETFGLSALESMASGTPVVVSRSSALPEIVGSAGAADSPEDFARGVTTHLAAAEPLRRAAARTRAEAYSWPTAVEGFLASLTPP